VHFLALHIHGMCTYMSIPFLMKAGEMLIRFAGVDLNIHLQPNACTLD